jgi:single-stranded DNA-binding protein
MLKITLIGFVGKDAELVQGEGKQFAKFPVAVDEVDKNGEKKTRWLNCYANQVALTQYITKGKQVFVEGFHRILVSTGQDGKTYVNEAVNVYNIQLLGRRDDQQKKDDAVDDLPFAH